MINILFFAPYLECIQTIKQVIAERNDKDITYEVVLDSFDNKLESIEADAIIARGFTAQTLKNLDIPYAELKTSGFDVMYAIGNCLRAYRKKNLALVGAFNMVYDSESITNVYKGINLKTYYTDKESKLENCLIQAITEGAEAIIGGCSTVALAKKYNMPSVLIESGKKAINSAIDNALSTYYVYKKEKQRSTEITNIMDYSFQGIISTDSEGIIKFANKQCYNIMNDIHQPLSGKNIKEVIPSLPIDDVLENNIKILSEIFNYKDKHIMVNCVPINSGSEISGSVITFQNLYHIQAEEGKIRKKLHKSGFVAKYSFSDIITKSSALIDTIDTAKHFSSTDMNILIHGETGTGKELFAQSIHNLSARRNGPFVAINCAALPEDILESELFGYVEGAFTGAARGGKMGFFEIAHKGTIFLDEIGDISPKLQSRLLRVLQEREIIRLGNDVVIPIDVRILSATNKNLMDEVEKGKFRQDLLYRLDVLELNIPPLRERDTDIIYLAENFIRYNHEHNGYNLKGLSEDAKNVIMQYKWPGNIRELQNFCQRLSILSQNAYADKKDLLNALPKSFIIKDTEFESNTDETNNHETFIRPLLENEKMLIEESLKLNGMNRTKTAQYLKIDKSTLWRKMKKYNIKI